MWDENKPRTDIANLRMDKKVTPFRLWGALLLRRAFYPGAVLWVKGEDGKWHNADDWNEIHPVSK